MKRLSPFYWIGRARKQFEDYCYESALRNFGEIKTEGITEMTEKTQKLKPCPFCGGEAKITGYILFEVKCRRCRAKLPQRYEGDAIAAWNRRTPQCEKE